MTKIKEFVGSTYTTKKVLRIWDPRTNKYYQNGRSFVVDQTQAQEFTFDRKTLFGFLKDGLPANRYADIFKNCEIIEVQKYETTRCGGRFTPEEIARAQKNWVESYIQQQLPAIVNVAFYNYVKTGGPKKNKYHFMITHDERTVYKFVIKHFKNHTPDELYKIFRCKKIETMYQSYSSKYVSAMLRDLGLKANSDYRTMWNSNLFKTAQPLVQLKLTYGFEFKSFDFASIYSTYYDPDGTINAHSIALFEAAK